MTKKEIAWDLTELFPSPEHPTVQKAMASLTKKAGELAKKYQGKIESAEFSAKDLLALLKGFEHFYGELSDLGLFARMSYSANMTIPEIQKLFNQFRKISADIRKQLAFFELEIGKLVHSNEQLISDPLLAKYKHYLEKLRREQPHNLSEVEEKLIIEKDQFGVDAWQLLQANWLNTREFEVEVEGEKKSLSYGEANGLLTHPDHATRTSVNKSIYGLLGQDGEIFATALRNICSDWLQICKRRKFDSPMHKSLITNDVDQKTIDNLMKSIEDHVALHQRYLKLKAKIMSSPKLGCEDIFAPLSNAPTMLFEWEKAKELTIRAYSKLDEDYAVGVKDVFVRNHIDASPRYGKRNGAFCSRWYNGHSSFILMTFTGALREVYTLAHELGHATHNHYSVKEQTILNTSVPMVIAETASIFGELLLTDLLLNEAKSDEEKKAILCRVLDGASRAIFQVSSRVWFEQSLYDAIERGEYLDGKTISKYWTAARDKVYGDAVKWFEEMDWEWTMKPHYYRARFRFYNYPYVFAQLFVYALYQKYLEEGKEFVPKFKKILSAGGSLSPKEIGEIMGVDISTPGFWKLGINQYEQFVDELEKLVKK